MKKSLKLIIKGYQKLPSNLLDEKGEQKKEVYIDIRRIALEIAKDKRSISSSSYLKDIPLLLVDDLIDSLSRSFPSSILEMETKELIRVIDSSFEELTLDYRNVPIHKIHRAHLSFSLGTGIGRVILQDYLDVICFDNIDYFYESYLKHDDVRLDTLNKLIINKIEKGNGPDVLCLNSDGTICLGEFKGRIDLKFKGRNYSGWKKQFSVVSINSTDSRKISDVNHICALSITTNRKINNYKSTLHIVDPPNNKNGEKINIKTSGKEIFLNHYQNALKSLGYFELSERLKNKEESIRETLPEPTEGRIKIKGSQESFIVPFSTNEFLEAIKNFKPEYIVCLDEDIYNILNGFGTKLIGTGKNIVDELLLFISKKTNTEKSNLPILAGVISSIDGFNLVPTSLIEGYNEEKN